MCQFQALEIQQSLNSLNSSPVKKPILNLSFEVGMNNYGEISYLSKMIKPDIGLINNAGSAHIKYFKSKKEIEKEKLELIHGLNSGGSLILNEDISINKSIKNFSKKNNIELIKFGQKDKSNNFLINYRYFPDGSLIEANFDTISLSFNS